MAKVLSIGIFFKGFLGQTEKGLTVNFKKIERMIVSKRNRKRSGIRKENFKTNQIQEAL